MTTCGSQEKVAPERGEDNRGFGNNLLVALTLALTLTLSPGRGNSVRPLVLGWILGNVRLLLPGRSETKQNARNLYGVGVAGRDLPLTGSSRARQRYQAAKER